jgi:hypothetical protein
MLGHANTHRALRCLVVGAATLGAGATLAVAAGPPTTRPTPPTLQPRSGQPFAPVQGDWEGTAQGFTASFNLVLDTARRAGAGTPRYGLQDLVVLRPVACPPSAARYGESILTGRLPSALGPHGSLGLARFGLQGGFTGARSATLSGGYSLPGCRGTLTWHLHPAVRRTVADGTWVVHWAGGEHSTFHVQAGGRLATSIHLPRSIAACNGLSGRVDVFIGVRGGAAISQGGVTLKLRFTNRRAEGTLAAEGCSGGGARVTASRVSG